MTSCLAKVTVSAANVRLQPIAGTTIVGIARRDEELPVHEVSNRDAQNFLWFNVTLPSNNSSGWIREDLVQLRGDCAFLNVTTTDPTEPITTDTGNTVPATTEVLVGDCQGTVRVFLARVRDEPSSAGDTLGMLSRSTTFAIKETSAPDSDGLKWYAFDYEDTTGWTREDLIDATGDCIDLKTHGEEEHEDPEPEPEPDPEVEGCVGFIGLARVNVRSGPSTSFGSVGIATQGETFPVKSVTDVQADGFNWVNINFNGQDGFVRFDLIGLQGDCEDFIDDDRLPSPVPARLTQGFHSGHKGVDFGIPRGTQLTTTIPAVVVRSQRCTKCEGDPSHIFTTDSNEINAIFSDREWGFGYGHHVILRHNISDLKPSVQQALFNAGALHDDFIFVLYAHMDRRDITLNQALDADTSLGVTGHTGYSTDPHLHLEVAVGKAWGASRKVHPATLFNIEHR